MTFTKKKFHSASDDAVIVMERHLTLEIGMYLMMAILNIHSGCVFEVNMRSESVYVGRPGAKRSQVKVVFVVKSKVRSR